MKKFILTIAMSSLVTATFAGINDFSDLKRELLKGSDLRALVDLDKCKMNEDLTKGKKEKMDAEGGFTIDSFYLNQGPDIEPVIMASHSHFSLSSQHGPVHMIVSMLANDSKNVTLHTSLLDANTYEVKSEHWFDCKYDKGIEFEKL